MTFEKFIPTKQNPHHVDPLITVGRTGIIGINKVAMDKYVLNECQYAELFYDAETNKIGIMPYKDKTAYSVTMKHRLYGGVDIAGVSFLRYFGILHINTMQYPAEWNEGMLVCQLKGRD